jgi:hypothetical protein
MIEVFTLDAAVLAALEAASANDPLYQKALAARAIAAAAKAPADTADSSSTTAATPAAAAAAATAVKQEMKAEAVSTDAVVKTEPEPAAATTADAVKPEAVKPEATVKAEPVPANAISAVLNEHTPPEVAAAATAAEVKLEGKRKRADSGEGGLDGTAHEQQQVPVSESIYASMAPTDFMEVLNLYVMLALHTYFSTTDACSVQSVRTARTC